MNKKFLVVIAPIILIATGVSFFLFWPKIESPEIKISGNTLSFFIARNKGFFNKENLQVKLVEKIPTQDEEISALLAGKVDYALGLSPETPIEASLRGAPIKTIIVPSTPSASCAVFFLIALPGLKLNDLKTVGVFSQYTFQYYLVLKFIEENNLDAKIISSGSQEAPWGTQELQSLLLANKVDAILLRTFPAEQLQSQGFPILATLIDTTPSTLSVRDDKIEKSPGEIKKVVRVMEKGIEFTVTNPKETMGLVLKYLGLKKTEKNIQIIEKEYSICEATHDKNNIPIDKKMELLIKVVKAKDFETTQEVEEQIVTQEEFDKVFDFRFVR